MSNGFPSMTALLGLLAVAGYQNRDKLAEMLGGGAQAGGQGLGTGMGGTQAGAPGLGSGMGGMQSGTSGLGAGQSQGGMGGLGGLLGGLGSGGVGGLLGGGIGQLVESFRQNGHGDVAESWVGTGPNKEVAPHQLEKAIGPDVLSHLTQQTGLSRDELLARLSRELPHAVDKYTPEGRLPGEGNPLRP